MIIRTKDTKFQTGNVSVLLDFIGVKKEEAGLQKVSCDVELITNVVLTTPVPGLPENTKTENGFLWTLSTFDLDRFGERVDPHGWDFSQYQKNPVVEWAHRYDIPAIGKIEGLAIDDSGLHGSVIFNSKDYDPFGWAIGERVKAGVIRAGSVGFRVLEIEIPDRKTQEDGTALIFRKQELLEFSICNVPANPWALAKSAEKPHPCGFSACSFCGAKTTTKALETAASLPPKAEEKTENSKLDCATHFWDCLINKF